MKNVIFNIYLTNKPTVDGKSFMCGNVIAVDASRIAACTNGH
jgi:hypothetical protein